MDKENKIIIILILVICLLIGSLNKSTSYFFNNETRNTVIKENSDPMEDYLIGVIACEMQASFNEETLKSQAIASRTYAYFLKSKNIEPTNDTRTQCLITKEKMKSIWKDDYDSVKQNIEINKWFPQTSMLLPFTQKCKYILNDGVIFEDQKVPKKGGYNPYRVFGVDYLSLIKESLDKGDITMGTFNIIKNDLLCDYLASRYFKTVIARMDKFEHDNIRKHLSVYYSSYAFAKLLLFAILSPLKYYRYKLWKTH